MLTDIPNFAFVIGYMNTCVDPQGGVGRPVSLPVARPHGPPRLRTVTPIADARVGARRAYIGMESGYLNRAMHLFPQRGSDGPWTAEQGYALDRSLLGAVDDTALKFTAATVESTAKPAEAVAV